jgi:hypothetical protein
MQNVMQALYLTRNARGLPASAHRYNFNKYKTLKTGRFCDKIDKADESRTHIVCQCALPAIFAFFALMGASPPASKKAENISKSTADRCFAVLPEQIFAQARQSTKRILSYCQVL